MLKPLLAFGYLPRELPPLFGSESFAALSSSTNELPTSITKDKADWTQPTHHNLARVGGLRRRLTVPNPANYFRLASVFDKHNAALVAEWKKSPYSQTLPKVSTCGPRGIANEPPDRAIAKANARVGARYLLRADISQFYPSVYTHTISWALHTKQVAKAAFKDMSLAENALDKELQACQLGQTKGIAIGPDTSLGVAELLLAPIDRRLKDECRIMGGVRFIDDMEFNFHKLADAEAALARLESMLYEYELQLNGNKTRILELPESLESRYVTELRRHIPTLTGGTNSQWIDYFNHAFMLAKEHPLEGVLRYAIAALQGVTATAKCWSIAQILLWQSVALDPGCLRFVTDVLLLHKHRASREPNSDIARTAVEALIVSSAPVGHGSEILWSIWTALQLGLTLSADAQRAIAGMDDAFVAVAAMVTKERKVFAEDFTSPLWESWLVEDCFHQFHQDHWLLGYEANRRGWFTEKVRAARVDSEPTVKALTDAGVTFINDKKLDEYLPNKLVVCSGGGYS
ncbi:RNA-directed DNA polymerase [Nitrospira sp. CMX1]